VAGRIAGGRAPRRGRAGRPRPQPRGRVHRRPAARVPHRAAGRPDAARQPLADAGLPRAVAQASGDGNLTVRTGQLDQAGEDRARQAVTAVGGQATELRDEYIGPTIGAELRRKALIALGIALAAQLGYLAARFRWTFGAAAVVAMVHDVAHPRRPVRLAGQAPGRGVPGRPADRDRLLGQRLGGGLRPHPRAPAGTNPEPLAALVNDACLQTIPRTVNTGLGALFILAALFLLGGDTLTDFALALLIGIGVGTWSSVLVAAPLLVAFEQGRSRP
jgi:SecD/SecF fusion protein